MTFYFRYIDCLGCIVRIYRETNATSESKSNITTITPLSF